MKPLIASYGNCVTASNDYGGASRYRENAKDCLRALRRVLEHSRVSIDTDLLRQVTTLVVIEWSWRAEEDC